MSKESSRKHKIAVSAPSLTSRGRGQAKRLVWAGPHQSQGVRGPKANLGKGFQPGFRGTQQGEPTATGRSEITEGARIP